MGSTHFLFVCEVLRVSDYITTLNDFLWSLVRTAPALLLDIHSPHRAFHLFLSLALSDF